MLPFSAVFGFMDVYAKQSNGTFASFYNEINSNGSVDSIKATFNLLLLTVTDTIGALVLMLITQKSKVVPEQKKLKFGWGIVLFLCCFGIGGVGSLVGAVVNSVVLLPGTAFQMIMNNILTGSDFNINQSILYGNDSWVYLITTIFVVGIFVPILEELIFRKLVVDNTSKYGYGAAIMISAFTFAVFHGNFTQFFYAFGLGLLFAYVYANTGKIRYTIFFHMGYNLYASAIMPLARKLIPTGVLNSIQSSLTQMTESIQSNPEGFMDAYNRYTFEISNYIQDPRVVLGILVTASANIFYFILIIVGFILMLVFLKKALGIRKNMMLGEKGTKRCAAFNWGAILFYVLGAGVFLFYYGVVYFGMIVQSFR
ncbi:MAG: CPBP family intramembrane metalloprotease [Lachnospiraceae bacterium]|nr:CPBP family intramembrane metalloprotease [Lachnospiraceae bacterium]